MRMGWQVRATSGRHRHTSASHGLDDSAAATRRPQKSGPPVHPPEPAYPCYLPVLGDSLDDAARGAGCERTRWGPEAVKSADQQAMRAGPRPRLSRLLVTDATASRPLRVGAEGAGSDIFAFRYAW